MVLNDVKNVGENKSEISFTIARDVFDKAVDAQFKKNLKNIAIPGFRKGKAPRAMVEKMYGKGVFYEDAINDVLPAEFDAALKESKLNAVSRPEIDIEEVGEDGIKVKAAVYTKPVAALGEYKGLKAEKVVTVATDKEVDAELERVRERNARSVEITDRAAQLDDTVNIDYEGSVDGIKFDGGTAKNQELKLGSHTFIDTYEDQIVGHNIGDEFDVNVTFPENYGKEDLNGKPAVFKVKLNSISFNELPELDDEFAKDVSDFDTLEAYKADIKANIQKRYDGYADNAVEGQLVDALLEVTTVSVPEPMIDTEVENIIRDRDYSMRSQGLSLDMYLKYTGTTLDDMKAQAKEQAERQVKTRLALERIVELEGITATEEDLNAEYEKMAAQYSMEADKIRESIPAEYISNDIAVRKAVDFIKANAVITEKAPEEIKEDKKDAE